MKHLIVLFILVLCNVGCSQNEKVTPQSNGTGLEEGTSNSLLWQVVSKNKKDTSYIFGTMHLIQKDYFYFPDLLEELIKKSDVVVMEIAEEPDPMETMKLMMLEEGELFDYFNEVQEDSILTWAKNSLGMSEEMFKISLGKMKPFAVSAMASQAEMLTDAESYEKTIMELIKEHKLKAEGLETVEEQMSIFDDFSMEEQTRMVMESIKDDPDAKAMTKKMMEVYSRQNIDSLYTMIHDEGGTIADKESELLINRNKNWIPKLKTIMKKQHAFIAVGAGHLAGPNGILELLRKKGYSVTPIKL